MLRDAAREQGLYKPITTNYRANPTAPIPHRLGAAADHARCAASAALAAPVLRAGRTLRMCAGRGSACGATRALRRVCSMHACTHDRHAYGDTVCALAGQV